MRMKLSVPPESIDWVMELLVDKEHEELTAMSQRTHYTNPPSLLAYLSPFDGFNSSFGFFFGVSFWIEDDLWLEKKNEQNLYSLSLKNSNMYHLLWTIAFTSASKVPAPVQDLNSHSVCQRYVSCELVDSHFYWWNRYKWFYHCDSRTKGVCEWCKNCERVSQHEGLHTCGASCCVCVVVGGGIWSGGLSHLGTRSWRNRNLFSAPWSFAGHGGRTECRASTTVFHPPLRKDILRILRKGIGVRQGKCALLLPFFCPPPCGQRHTVVCTAHMSAEVHTSSPSWYNAGT